MREGTNRRLRCLMHTIKVSSQDFIRRSFNTTTDNKAFPNTTLSIKPENTSATSYFTNFTLYFKKFEAFLLLFPKKGSVQLPFLKKLIEHCICQHERNNKKEE